MPEPAPSVLVRKFADASVGYSLADIMLVCAILLQASLEAARIDNHDEPAVATELHDSLGEFIALFAAERTFDMLCGRMH